MFGGESKIPPAVKKAMILSDYDKGMAAFANAAKDYANFVIRDYMQPGSADKFKDNVFDTMVADAHRAIFIFNGTTYKETPAAELVPVFKSIVPDPAKQKALSSWLNQLCTTTFMSPSMGVPYGETGVNAIKLKGAGALANRDMTAGVFKSSLLDAYGHDLVHDLEVSPDGKTATITQTITADLSSPGGGYVQQDLLRPGRHLPAPRRRPHGGNPDRHRFQYFAGIRLVAWCRCCRRSARRGASGRLLGQLRGDWAEMRVLQWFRGAPAGSEEQFRGEMLHQQLPVVLQARLSTQNVQMKPEYSVCPNARRSLRHLLGTSGYGISANDSK